MLLKRSDSILLNRRQINTFVPVQRTLERADPPLLPRPYHLPSTATKFLPALNLPYSESSRGMFQTAWHNTKTVILFVGLVAILAGLAGGFARGRGASRSAGDAIASVIPQWSAPPTRDIGPEGADAFAAVAQRITPAVVRIETEKLPGDRRSRWLPNPLRGLVPSDSSASVPEMAGGSGFLVSPEGYILTNNHVVADADIITVTLYNKRSFAARIIGLDPTTDVALIKIEATDLPFVPLGDSDNAKVGEWVLA